MLVKNKYVVCLCTGCDGCCVFCVYYDVWSCSCSCMGSMSVSSCVWCMFVSCVHHVSVLNASFCMFVNVSVRFNQLIITFWHVYFYNNVCFLLVKLSWIHNAINILIHNLNANNVFHFDFLNVEKH